MADTTYFIKDGYLYRHRENDGAAYLKRGPEAEQTRLCTIEEAKIKYPNELMRATGARPHAVH